MARDGDLRGDFGRFELVKEKDFTQGSQRTQRLKSQEILEELLAAGGENGFGMELDTFDFVAAVT
jgi:hypothetical protein